MGEAKVRAKMVQRQENDNVRNRLVLAAAQLQDVRLHAAVTPDQYQMLEQVGWSVQAALGLLRQYIGMEVPEADASVYLSTIASLTEQLNDAIHRDPPGEVGQKVIMNDGSIGVVTPVSFIMSLQKDSQEMTKAYGSTSRFHKQASMRLRQLQLLLAIYPDTKETENV